MKKKKIRIYLIICLLLLICTTVIVYAYANTETSINLPVSKSFTDVQDTDWYASDVQYVNDTGLMSGTSDELFSPNETTTRGMIVTVLWRLENKPNENNCAFTDVEKDAYYYTAVCWANKSKIVSGYDDETFAAEDDITREQLASIIYRYAGYKNYDLSKKSSLETYQDCLEVSEYAVSAFEWAIANGIITGTSEDTLSPQGNALRCQVAAIFKRFCRLYCAEENESSSTQVQEPNESANHQHINHSTHTHVSPSQPQDTEKEDIIVKDDVPTLTVDSVSAHPGDEIQVTVKVTKNPGILGMTLSAYFDQASFDLLSVENGEAFRNVLNLTPADVLECGSVFLWDGVELNDTDVKDGDILLLKFKVSDSAPEGKYPITIKVVDGDVVDRDLNALALQIESGFITVTKK